MKKTLFIVLFLCCALFVHSQQKIEVYLLAGQSNATGQGYLHNLNSDLIYPTNVLLFHSGKPHLEGKNIPYAWAGLAQASETPDRFGPELGIAYQLNKQNPKAKIAIIKHAHSGTNLYKDWNPGANNSDSLNFGTQYKHFVFTVNKALTDLEKQGYLPILKGIFWQQGEGDAEKLVNAQNYQQNLTHFIKRVRLQFNSPKMPFVFGKVLPPPNDYDGREVLRSAQEKVSKNKELKPIFLINTDDLSRRATDKNTPYPNDYLHFGTQGTWDLGIRMAKVLR